MNANIKRSDGSFISSGIIMLVDKDGKLSPVLKGTEDKYLKMGYTIAKTND